MIDLLFWKIVFHIIIIVVGLAGIILGTLPDLFPDLVPKVLFGENRRMEIGYGKLIEFLNIPRGERGDRVALTRHDEGYMAIYRLMRNFNPKLMPLQKNQQDETLGNISFDKANEFVNEGNFLTPNKVAFYEVADNSWESICTMRDLKYLINDSHVRVLTRFGFLLTLIAISIEGFFAIRSLING